MENITIRQIIKDHFYLFHLYPVKWSAIFRRVQFVPLEKQVMVIPSLKDNPIDKLRKIEDPALLTEVSNLFELQESETAYQTNVAQRKAILESKQQAKEGRTISNK